MRKLRMMNGWREAPHLWWRYLLLPFRFEWAPWGCTVGLFGFVFFVLR